MSNTNNYYKIKHGLEIPSQDSFKVTESTYPAIRPALMLDFQNSNTVDERISFSRASTGTYYDANGVLQTEPSGVARFDHNPVTGVSLGLLRENQATNLVTYSEDFANAAWVKEASTIIPNTLIAPDGTLTASTHINNPSANMRLRQTITTVIGQSYVSSIFVRKGSTPNITLIAFTTAFANLTRTEYNFDTDTLSNPVAKRDIVGNGWVRVSLPFTATTTGTLFWYRTGTVNGTANATSHIWGAQLEENSFATSYIKTVASQVTRAADVATLANVDTYNTDEFTAVTKPFGVSSVASNLVTLNGDAPIERLYVYPRNISQGEINTLVENDGYWSWRIVGADFALPNFTTDGTVEVDWGDGTVETLTTAVHTFANASPHTVRFKLTSGTTFAPRINANATHRLKVVALGSAPSNMIVDCNIGFTSCTNLKSIDATLISGTSFSFAWYQCSSLTSFPLIDTSAGTNFSRAWQSCTSLTSFPLINTSSGTNFNTAWYLCNSLTSFPLIDTSSGTNFSDTWNGCTSLTSFPLLDMSLAENLNECWDTCTSLTSFPAIDFPVCTNFTAAWYNCSDLTSFPLIDTSSGTNFFAAWYNCSDLTSFPLIDTSSGTNFFQTWYNCNSLTSFPLINTSAGTNFDQTWRSCSSLTSFPLIDTSSGTIFSRAWSGCNSLTSFPLIDTSSGTNFTFAWSGCNSLTSFPLIDTSSGTNFEQTWRSCSSLTSFPLIDTSSGTSFFYAWEGCTSLTDFPANFFDSWVGVPDANCFLRTWDGCSALTTTSVENILVSIDTSAVSAPATGTEITIDYDTGTGALTSATNTAITSLKAKNWTIKINGVLE